MEFAIIYFVLAVWSFVCLLVALCKRDQVAVQAFVILLPMTIIGLMNNINSLSFYLDLFG